MNRQFPEEFLQKYTIFKMIYLCKWLKNLCHLRFRKHLKFKVLFCMSGAWYKSNP